jgi:hypothetical protein
MTQSRMFQRNFLFAGIMVSIQLACSPTTRPKQEEELSINGPANAALVQISACQASSTSPDIFLTCMANNVKIGSIGFGYQSGSGNTNPDPTQLKACAQCVYDTVNFCGDYHTNNDYYVAICTIAQFNGSLQFDTGTAANDELQPYLACADPNKCGINTDLGFSPGSQCDDGIICYDGGTPGNNYCTQGTCSISDSPLG